MCPLAGADVTQWRPAIMPSYRRPSCPVRGDTATTLSTSPPWSPWPLATLSTLSPVQPEIDLLFVRRSLPQFVWESIPPYDDAATKTELHIDEELYRACSHSAALSWAAQGSYDQCLAPDCILHRPRVWSGDLGPLSPRPACHSGHQRPVDRGMLPG